MSGTVYDAAGGMPFFRALADAWHRRCLADEVLAHPFSHGVHPEHSERLAAYWAECCGGPRVYTDQFGDESTVQRMHAGNGDHPELDRLAEREFDAALVDLTPRFDLDAVTRSSLSNYFRWSNARMAAHPRSAEDVPAGQSLPTWDFGSAGNRP